MISEKSLSVVRATVGAVAGALDQITPRFYERMFTAHPELLRDLFNRSNQDPANPVGGDQPKALAASIAGFATLVLADDRSHYDDVLDRIVHKHASLGVVAEQYPIVHEHLFAAIVDVLGDAVTPEVAEAWTELYWLMADELISRERAVYRAAGVEPGEVWMPARVVRRHELTDDVIAFELVGVESALPTFTPGQYTSVQVTLPDGARQIRQYSLSAPSRDTATWQIAVRRLDGHDNAPDGEVSTHLTATAVEGTVISVSIPVGLFVVDDSERPVVLVSAGIGCTPMVSLLQGLVARASSRPVRVLHADHSPATHAYRAETAGLVRRLADGAAIFWYREPDDGTGTDGDEPAARTGRLDVAAVDLPGAQWFVCGPVAFLRTTSARLRAEGVGEDDIHLELFDPFVPDELATPAAPAGRTDTR